MPKQDVKHSIARLSRHRLLIEWLAGTALLLSAALIITWHGAHSHSIGSNRIDASVFDALRGLVPIEVSNDIALIEIDDASLQQIGHWPWPRAIHATLIERLAGYGVRSLGLDLMLIEASEQDRLLGEAIEQFQRGGARIVMPIDSTRDEEMRPLPLYPEPLLGEPSLLAHAHFQLDDDGMVRGLYLTEGGFPAFALQLAALAGWTLGADESAALAESDQAARNRSVEERDWPVGHFALIPAISGTPHRYSYGDVLRGAVPQAAFRGKLVLIGATAAGMGDRYATGVVPGRSLSPGLDLHVATLSAIEQGRLVRSLPPWAQLATASVCVLALMIALYRLPPRRGLLLTIGMLLALLLGSALCYRLGAWWSPSGTVVAALFAYPLWSWRRLEAATSGVAREAQALRQDPPLLMPGTSRRLPAEPVGRSLQVLAQAASQVLSLQRFLLLTLQRLPHPAFVTDARDHLVFANDRLSERFGGAPARGTPMLQWLGQVAGLSLRALPREARQELTDSRGRDWLIDAAPFEDPLWHDVTLVQLVDVSPIRGAQRRREAMLRFLSHDLRSPQISILSIIDAQRDLGPSGSSDPSDPPGSSSSPGSSLPWLTDIRAQARRTLDLAEGFVQLARAEDQAPPRHLVDLAAIATEACDICWAQARARQVRIEQQGVREGAWVRGDATLLQRVLVNLIDNAIKYGHAGSRVEIRIEAADGPQARWEASVRDHGPGLGAIAVDHMFDPYWRAGTGAPGTQEPGGVGLGLAFVKAVIDGHQGSVSARNAPGAGAELRFWLPAIGEETD